MYEWCMTCGVFICGRRGADTGRQLPVRRVRGTPHRTWAPQSTSIEPGPAWQKVHESAEMVCGTIEIYLLQQVLMTGIHSSNIPPGGKSKAVAGPYNNEPSLHLKRENKQCWVPVCTFICIIQKILVPQPAMTGHNEYTPLVHQILYSWSMNIFFDKNVNSATDSFSELELTCPAVR